MRTLKSVNALWKRAEVNYWGTEEEEEAGEKLSVNLNGETVERCILHVSCVAKIKLRTRVYTNINHQRDCRTNSTCHCRSCTSLLYTGIAGGRFFGSLEIQGNKMVFQSPDNLSVIL